MTSLEERVAALIDASAFSMKPEHYGLKTDEEFCRTMAFGAQQVAREKAAQIIAVCAEEMAKIADEQADEYNIGEGWFTGKSIAAAIRSMGERG